MAYVLANKDYQTLHELCLIPSVVYFRHGNESLFYNRMVVETIGSVIVKIS